MLTKSHLRRALAPVMITGLLTTSVVGVAAPSAATSDFSADDLASMAPRALEHLAVTSPAALALPASSESAAQAAAPAQSDSQSNAQSETLSPQRVVHGAELKAKPEPWVLPVEGYDLTGRFGASSGMWSSTHTGLDFAAAEGSELRAIGPGVVTETVSDGSYGNKTVLTLDDGTVLWYAHQSEFAAEPGQRVEPGDLIGYVGSTGNVTGPHLHLEVHPTDGEPVDPEAWLPEHQLQA